MDFDEIRTKQLVSTHILQIIHHRLILADKNCNLELNNFLSYLVENVDFFKKINFFNMFRKLCLSIQDHKRCKEKHFAACLIKIY